MPKLILASASPRRREYLQQLVDEFDVVPADVDESRLVDESPSIYVQRVAKLKADTLLAQVPDSVILAADTTVTMGETILAKPDTFDDACQMLRQLSGKTHHVLTCVVVRSSSMSQAILVKTSVEFDSLTETQILRYCRTEEPYDKAGGYGIQGSAARFVIRLNGSYSGVVGLPLVETTKLLRHAGIAVVGDQ